MLGVGAIPPELRERVGCRENAGVPHTKDGAAILLELLVGIPPLASHGLDHPGRGTAGGRRRNADELIGSSAEPASRSRRGKPWADTQIGFIAVSTRGEVGGYALRPGFSYAVASADGVRVVAAESMLDA